MYKRGSNPGDHCLFASLLISGLTGRAREHLRMGVALDGFAIDGGLEQVLEHLRQKLVFVDHRKRCSGIQEVHLRNPTCEVRVMTSWINRFDEALVA